MAHSTSNIPPLAIPNIKKSSNGSNNSNSNSVNNDHQHSSFITHVKLATTPKTQIRSRTLGPTNHGSRTLTPHKEEMHKSHDSTHASTYTTSSTMPSRTT